MAKGASYEEATRLHNLKKAKESKDINVECQNTRTKIKNDDDNDEFLRRYREKRLKELKKEKYGAVIPIQRNEWNHQVNEASQDGTWVIINLTAQKSSPNIHPTHKEICLLIDDQIIPTLAIKHPTIKFVSIPSTSAIENWPENNLPTLFCYRYGKLQCQLVGLKEFGIVNSVDRVDVEDIELRLEKLGVVDLENILDDGNASHGKLHNTSMQNCGQQWKSYDDDESDYDDVD